MSGRDKDIECRLVFADEKEKKEISGPVYEAEIYRLKNMELIQKVDELAEKAKQLEIENERLSKEIARRKQVQENLEKANKKLESLLTIDVLTGIPNRLGFDRVLKLEWGRCMRERTLLSLILIDVDFFKEFNDNQGHLAGDECLKQVAKTLSGSVRRPGDFVARYGGEEFGVILPNTGSEGANMLAEQMRKSIESLVIVQEGSGSTCSITISLGTATAMPTAKSSIRDFINAADKALYKAKGEGRNRVSSASPFPNLQSP